MMSEADRPVGGICRIVVGLHVEHPLVEALVGQPFEPGQGHGFAEPAAVLGWIDRDHVDLAQWWIMISVGLCPAEPDQLSIDVEETEAFGIKPLLGHGLLHLFAGPTPLFRMPVEGTIVDRYEVVDIVDGKSSGDELGRAVGQRTSELPEIAIRLEPEIDCHGVGARVHCPDPELDGSFPEGRQGICDIGSEIHTISVLGHDDDPAELSVLGALDRQTHGARVATLRRRRFAQRRAAAARSVSGSSNDSIKGLIDSLWSNAMAKPRSPKGRARVTNERLAEEYPEAECELDHRNPFELLVATILSAQATDVGVNKATPRLFSRFPNPWLLAEVEPEDVHSYVDTIGLFRQKSKSLVGMARMLVDDFDGEVPHAMKDLVRLPGVGRKTANVVRSVALDEPGLPVDTHVTRLCNLLGITTETDAVKIETELNPMVPERERGEFSLRVILHGRRVCIARRPRCDECVLNDFCPSSQL